MHGGDYAWILPGETIDLSGMAGDWWHNGPEDCSTSQLSETLNGLIIVQSYGTSLTEEASYSGLVSLSVYDSHAFSKRKKKLRRKSEKIFFVD